jgi:predicted nucleic acid-binding protein
MTSLFLDTSYLIAVEVEDDQNHLAASLHWKHLLRSPLRQVVTTSYVVNEVVTWLNGRGLHGKAIEVGDNLLASKWFNVVHVNEELFYESWGYFKKHKDKSYSLTDCTSFVLMKRLRISEALTFDKHFSQAGFKKLP